MQIKIAVLAGVIALLLVNWSIVGKERHLQDGQLVYLELAPVDPRSLMQGDYMALNYKVANLVYAALPKKKNRGWRQGLDSADGRLVVQVDTKLIGHFKRLENDVPLASDEVLLRFRVRGGMLKFATNAFYFQEGYGKYYESARYGLFRVDRQGELLLASLHDKNLQRIIPDRDKN